MNNIGQLGYIDEGDKAILNVISENIKVGEGRQKNINLYIIIREYVKARKILWDLTENKVTVIGETPEDGYSRLISIVSFIQKLTQEGYVLLIEKATDSQITSIEDESIKGYKRSNRVGLAHLTNKMANQYIFPTKKLQDFIINGYKTMEQIHHEMEMEQHYRCLEEAKEQTRHSRNAFRVAILALVVNTVIQLFCLK